MIKKYNNIIIFIVLAIVIFIISNLVNNITGQTQKQITGSLLLDQNIEKCANQCPYPTAKRCSNLKNYRVCGNFDSDPCLEWGKYEKCKFNLECYQGTCMLPCKNECVYGSTECYNYNSYRMCDNWDNDRCYEWSSQISCQQNSICNQDECLPIKS